MLRVFIQQVASVLSLKSAYKKSDAGSHLIFSLATGLRDVQTKARQLHEDRLETSLIYGSRGLWGPSRIADDRFSSSLL